MGKSLEIGLYTENVKFAVRNGELLIEGKSKTETYAPNEIPYDVVIVTHTHYWASGQALAMLYEKKKSFFVMDYDGGISLENGYHNPNSKIAQYEAYFNDRLSIAARILNAKFKSSALFLNAININTTFNHVSGKMSVKEQMAIEAKNANIYWGFISQYLKKEYGWLKFKRRASEHGSNVNAADPFNALLNWGYKILEVWIRRLINGSGLDPYLGFVHNAKDSHSALVYDLMEMFRSVIDKAIIFNLARFEKADFYQTHDYRTRLTDPAKHKLTELIEKTFQTKISYKDANRHQIAYVMQDVVSRFAIDPASCKVLF